MGAPALLNRTFDRPKGWETEATLIGRDLQPGDKIAVDDVIKEARLWAEGRGRIPQPNRAQPLTDGPGTPLTLRRRNRNFATPRTPADADDFVRYRATQKDSGGCDLKARCTPYAPARKIMRSIHEGARDLARDIGSTDAYVTSRRQRKKVEMLFAHLKRILKLDRLRLRGP